MIDRRRNTTNYYFNGRLYRKGRLVLGVVTHYASMQQIESLEILKQLFPKKLNQKYEVVEDFDKAKDRFPQRYFLKENEVGYTLDGGKYVVCNQWGIGNINLFTQHAATLGIDIKTLEVFNKKGDRYDAFFGAIGSEIKKTKDGEFHVRSK